MITDAVVGWWISLLEAIVELAPDMPVKPEVFDTVFTILQAGNYFFPIYDLVGNPLIPSVFGLLFVWRLVRLFLPGG